MDSISDFYKPVLPMDPVLVEPVEALTCTYQGHGPECHFFRHIRLDNYAVSTIGEPVCRTTLPHKYECRLFRIETNGQYTPLKGKLIYPNRLKSIHGHKELVDAVTEALMTYKRHQAQQKTLKSNDKTVRNKADIFFEQD